MITDRYIFLEAFAAIVGEPYLIADTERMYSYAKDVTTNRCSYPVAVVIPGSAEEIAELLKVCNAHKLKVTVRGGGTGVSGGSVAPSDGVILSLERLNKITEINKVDRIVIAEA